MSAPPLSAGDTRFLDCVHCGLCLEACPTYQVLGTEPDSPRGRIHLMQALAEGRLAAPEVAPHLDRCLGCLACESVCPSGVAYGSLLESARPVVGASRPWLDRFIRGWLVGRLFSDAGWTRRALQPLHWLGRVGLGPERWRRAPGRLGWWARLAPPPSSHLPAPETWAPRGRERGVVGLLRGCAADALRPDLTAAAGRVAAALGYRVVAPRAIGCCGALALHAGDTAGALAAARASALAMAAAPQWITTAAGCGAMVRRYGDLLANDAGRAASAAVQDASVFCEAALAERPVPLAPFPQRVAYQDACHLLHGQGVSVEPRQLLQRIPDLDLVELADGALCCGSAGSYNLTEPAMASALLERKIRAIEASGADCVVTGNTGCLLQLQAGLRHHQIRAVHLVELLDWVLCTETVGTEPAL